VAVVEDAVEQIVISFTAQVGERSKSTTFAATDERLDCRAESVIPCARRTFKAYSVWAHDVITLCTCSAADKLLVIFRGF